jgi:hypothetical protein
MNIKRKGGEKMKKIILGISLFSLVLLALLAYSAHVFADDKRPINHDRDNDNNSRNFNPDKQLSKSACGDDLKNPVINVTQKVQNDADSGVAGNYWAFDYYTRHITVWQIPAPTPVENGSSTYCAIVIYDGKFYAVPGQEGPQGVSGQLINTPTNAPVNGDMSGGYRALITAIFNPSGSWPKNGNVGTTNYQCDILGHCLGRVDWVAQYFPSYNYNTDFTQPWWGWKYDGGSHGTWINASTGNSGNIL